MHKIGHLLRGLRENEFTQRESAQHLVLLVNHIHVHDRVHFAFLLADVCDGLRGGEGGRNGDDISGHEAAGGVIGIGEQQFHFLALFILHHFQQVFAALLGQFCQQVSRLIRRHFLQHIGNLFIGHVLNQGSLEFRFHLLQCVR